MFRAFVLSIVLTLAIGSNAALLCSEWCDTHAAVASGCRHEDHGAAPTMTGDNRCESVVVGGAAFLREDLRRGVSSPHGDHAVAVSRYQLTHSTAGDHRNNNTARDWSLETRPVPTALRL